MKNQNDEGLLLTRRVVIIYSDSVRPYVSHGQYVAETDRSPTARIGLHAAVQCSEREV